MLFLIVQFKSFLRNVQWLNPISKINDDKMYSLSEDVFDVEKMNASIICKAIEMSINSKYDFYPIIDLDYLISKVGINKTIPDYLEYMMLNGIKFSHGIDHGINLTS